MPSYTIKLKNDRDEIETYQIGQPVEDGRIYEFSIVQDPFWGSPNYFVYIQEVALSQDTVNGPIRVYFPLANLLAIYEGNLISDDDNSLKRLSVFYKDGVP